ncbi:hypothetical protein HHK36_029224 [Tetracentron sinense]|uniref:Uncharacterized protein n=1 Tax=Tetracentron sinense TaxID=13715 RepID=A0A834YGF3_TETSI|nr:hypothetical protein HHK36_029224 [Tetracentron sinense]
MATTLSLLNLPTLSHKPLKTLSKLPDLSKPTKPLLPKHSNNQQKLINETIHQLKSSSLPLTALALPFFLDPNASLTKPSSDALAVGGELGLLEGRTLALFHPIVMGGLFFYTLWAGYLGWQWRRVRTIQNEINELKKQVKPVLATPDGTPSEASVSPLEAQIQQLTEERKALLKGSYRDRHFNAGSILLGFGVFEAIGGGLNTWFRTGKLFPGPHLFAGAAITVLWAAAASLVPAMQKGNETARNLHIALNGLNVLLFVWQIPTGIDIVFKVFEFTNWP